MADLRIPFGFSLKLPQNPMLFDTYSDEEISDLESDEQTLASQEKQVTRTTITSAIATAAATAATPTQPTLKNTDLSKLGRSNQKLRKKIVEELTDLYNATENASFRDAILNAFHQKRMDELKDWEEQIGE